MGIGQIQISTTPARLQIQRTPEQQQIQQEQYTLKTQVTHPTMKIESTLPKVTIDQSQCFSESGLKGIADFMEETVSYAKGAMLQSIARIAEQGTQLSNIHNNPNTIADQAYSNAYEQFDKDWNYGTMPTSRPKIDVVEGQNDIQVTEGTFTNNTQKAQVSHQFTPSKISYAMGQYGSISINYTPKVDTKF